MRRHILLMIAVGIAATTARAETFAPAPLAPDLGLDALTKRVAREQLGRDLFADPWAAVTLSHVDVYDRFPYVESRHFLIVSDPAWNRVVGGEVGKSLAAFDGATTPFGALRAPRGLAVDDRDRVYVADAGNDRVVVLQASTTFDKLSLAPLFVIDGLSDPHGVAWSDGGTPFAPDDDLLFVTDTGRNRVAAFAVGGNAPRLVTTLGSLGSGNGRFAGPLAITVGRETGASTRDVYVADSHNRRIVHLTFADGRLTWADEQPSGADAITSLAADEWGNVYATAPQQGAVLKWNARLERVAELHQGATRPRSLHVPYFTVRDHRDGRTLRAGQPAAIVLEPWGESSGLRRWDLGVSVEGLAVSGSDVPRASFTLTDRASVSLELREAGGRLLARRDVGTLDAGHADVALSTADLAMAPAGAELSLAIVARPGYPDGAEARAQARFRTSGAGIVPPTAPAVLPAWPNPMRDETFLRFALPAGAEASAKLSIVDASGRRIRGIAGPFIAGVNQVRWDGRDDGGRAVRPGFYFFRLDADGMRFTRRLAVVK